MPSLVRGLILRQMGRLSEAEASFAEALSIDPKDQRAQQLLAGVDSN